MYCNDSRMDDQLVACGATLAFAGFGAYLAGPVGIIAAGLLVLTVGVCSGPTTADQPTDNCPNCGAVVDEGACDHCGRSPNSGP